MLNIQDKAPPESHQYTGVDRCGWLCVCVCLCVVALVIAVIAVASTAVAGVQGDQSREVVRVLVECCLQEARYNPYYGHLAARLAAVSKGYKVGRGDTAGQGLESEACCSS